MANFNTGPLGSSYTGGVTNYETKGLLIGEEQTVKLIQGTDLSISLSAVLVAQWTAPFPGLIRRVDTSNYAVTAVASYDIYNLTTTTSIVDVTALVTNAVSTVTTLTSNTFAAGDVIQLRITTDGGGALKGFQAWLLIVPTADSLFNQYAT